MTKQTELALEAVKIRKRQGPLTARIFARRNGVSSLYRLALQLEAVKHLGV